LTLFSLVDFNQPSLSDSYFDIRPNRLGLYDVIGHVTKHMFLGRGQCVLFEVGN